MGGVIVLLFRGWGISSERVNEQGMGGVIAGSRGGNGFGGGISRVGN